MVDVMKRYDFAGKTVVVTGASMGIGEAFARELARRKARLVLVARSADKLAALAHSLSNAMVVVEDLATPGAARRVFDAVAARGWDVDVLINNAGFGLLAPFADAPVEQHREAIAVNVNALVELSHVFLPMIARQRGGILHVASTAAFQPVPYMAVYGASKAFVLSFSEALWGEYRDQGVRVVALCPGATDTPFFSRAGDGAAVGKKVGVAGLVEFGLAAFDANKPSAIHGFGNAMTAFSTRFVSRKLTAKISTRIMKPRAAATSPRPA